MALVRRKRPDGETDAITANRGLDVLANELWHAEPGVRRAAVRDLAALPVTAPEAAAEIAGGGDASRGNPRKVAIMLCDRLDVETSPSVRSAIMTSLIAIGTPEVAARLTDHLHSEDTQLRNAAIEALQEMPDAVVPLMERLLADEDSDVRIFAVNILSVLQHQQAAVWLVGVIRTDPHINVCTAALDGLVEVGATGMISDIEHLATRFPENPFMRFAADTAIRRIRGA